VHTATSATRVLAILVVHDGEPWLPRALDAIEGQTHAPLDVLAVDNGSTDGSRDLLIDRLGEDRVLVAERDLGFGAAVSMALDAAASRGAEHVVFLHDDLALAPDAIAELSAHLDADPRLAVVGCKLVDLDDPRRLQHVGSSIDVTGRADPGVEEDELDQGQRDAVQRALYVSTAGMMVRREVFETLGRFDRRYHLFRDDLDLCWRAWLAGHDVEVVPSAVGEHQASATNYGRLGQTAFIGPRYFAERNTLATLLKTYSAPRLLYVLPLFLLVGVAKVVGFVVTRRLSDAWQTVRAWLWNVLHLRETRRLRRQVQATRVRTDAELSPLFLKVTARLRAYAEAIGDWVAGGDASIDDVAPPDASAEPATATERVVAAVRARPVTFAAAVLAVLGVVVALPLLTTASIRGGELAPWPSDASAFLTSYVASWHEPSGFGTAAPPSPAQAVLGLLTVLAAGSSWLAPRLLLLGAVPLAWVLMLRAGRLATLRRLPRLAAATAYALSPPLLAALRTGRVGALVVGVCLPALAITVGTLARPDARADATWRNTAAAAMVTAVMVAFAPPSALAVVVALVAGLVATARLVPAGARRATALRLVSVVAGAFLLLFPWSLELVRPGTPVLGGPERVAVAAQPFWRWLLLAPELVGFPGILAGAGLLAAGLLGLVFGTPRRPFVVAGLWAAALAGMYGAWVLGRSGVDAWAWAGLPLLLTAMALAGLLAVAFSSAGAQLGEHDFGWRQVASVVTGLVVAAGMAGATIAVARAPWDAYALADTPLPAFIPAEEEAVGPFRVLVLADDGGTVSWDLTGPAGPTMASFGVRPPALAVDAVQGVVDDVLGGSDPGAAGRLGLANVRYVVVPEEGRSRTLETALAEQIGLEPTPVVSGRLFRVAGWAPRVAVVDRTTARAVERLGELPSGAEVRPLLRDDPTRYEATDAAPDGGSVLVAEVAEGGWEAAADGVPIPVERLGPQLRFGLSGPADYVLVAHDQQARRTALVLAQLAFVLVALSLMLRPPRFAREDTP
jgi:GT2 family glycosyltransferase